KRGYETMRWGPLKPCGFENLEKKPFAVVQLRPENKERTMYSLVGFQTQLKIKEQERIFRMIPGLENAEFLRYGKVHKNIYINSPKILNPDLSLKKNKNIFFAGQITGTEGYVEAVAGGLVAGINAFLRKKGKETLIFPKNTAIGALINYITSSNNQSFSPMNINLGLFEDIPKFKDKREKRKFIAERAISELKKFIDENERLFKGEVKDA
ncbi:MAG: methylenetetrahydrofolate--tRNA-(uracil(54)-C(5))-methyltransferase (FADH(2)-oxidizing) TrmFO, partial [candidate division WOR-3 bacterium]